MVKVPNHYYGLLLHGLHVEKYKVMGFASGFETHAVNETAH
jgi:hypothetical protein